MDNIGKDDTRVVMLHIHMWLTDGQNGEWHCQALDQRYISSIVLIYQLCYCKDALLYVVVMMPWQDSFNYIVVNRYVFLDDGASDWFVLSIVHVQTVHATMYLYRKHDTLQHPCYVHICTHALLDRTRYKQYISHVSTHYRMCTLQYSISVRYMSSTHCAFNNNYLCYV